MTGTVLLIDDDLTYLKRLSDLLTPLLGDRAKVQCWSPNENDDKPPIEYFAEVIATADVRLVITDYDLTRRGQLGFFGATVVDWCQKEAIPVGDFSRGLRTSLAEEPNLFELRVPIDRPDSAATYIAAVHLGFDDIRSRLISEPRLLRQSSPSATLALLLDQPQLESQLFQYFSRYGGVTNALVGKIKGGSGEGLQTKLLCYIAGHLLANAVLRFPGPIVDKRGLEAYFAVAEGSFQVVPDIFEAARYAGPFSDLREFFWVHLIDSALETSRALLEDSEEFSSSGAYNRALLEITIEQQYSRDARCTRCQGAEGGFLCPFTDRTVCERPDCSVQSNIWIPAGARLSRFESDFYNEWAPILGM